MALRKSHLYGFAEVRPMTREWRSDVAKFPFQTFQKRNRLKIHSYPLWGQGKDNKSFFKDNLFTLLYAAKLALSR